MHTFAQTSAGAAARRPLFGKLASAACLLAMVVASAYASVPLPVGPVPMTMQSLAVLLAGIWGGPRVGAGVCAAYFAMAAAGLPVLAGGTSAPGLALLARPSAGYLFAFVPAAAVAGTCYRLFASRAASALAALTAGHAVILAGGVTWLAGLMPFGNAVAAGLLPFLTGTAVKVALGVAVVVAAGRLREAVR